jgi:endo-beta-N-acetylglucosaminidase D
VTWNKNEEQEREVEKERATAFNPYNVIYQLSLQKTDTSSQMVAYAIDNVVVAKYPS